MSHPISLTLNKSILTEDEWWKIHRSISSPLSSSLMKHFYFGSILDLFQNDYSKLKRIALELDVDFKKLVELRKNYAEILINSRCRSSKEFFINESVRVLTGTSKLDSFFAAIPQQSIVEIVGASGSYKTTLISTIALESCSNNKIIIIDADQSLSKVGLQKVLLKKYEKYRNQQERTDELIKIYKIFNFQDLLDFFEFLSQTPTLHNSILIIDSINPLMFGLDQIRNSKFVANQLFFSLQCLKNIANLQVIYTKVDCKESECLDRYDFRIDLKKHSLDDNVDVGLQKFLRIHFRSNSLAGKTKETEDLIISINELVS
uniref:Uncharacterized protein n=1 Tax=Sarcoptes scabiei TaxID=52283 RepID=A0A834VCV9_SARSC